LLFAITVNNGIVDVESFLTGDFAFQLSSDSKKVWFI